MTKPNFQARMRAKYGKNSQPILPNENKVESGYVDEIVLSTNKTAIFLDDYRNIEDMTYMLTDFYLDNEWTIVRNVKEFAMALCHNMTHVSFDHDLLPCHYELKEEDVCSKDTGGEALQLLLDYVKTHNLTHNIEIGIHTQNGKANFKMRQMIKDANLPNLKIVAVTPNDYLC